MRVLSATEMGPIAVMAAIPVAADRIVLQLAAVTTRLDVDTPDVWLPGLVKTWTRSRKVWCGDGFRPGDTPEGGHESRKPEEHGGDRVDLAS